MKLVLFGLFAILGLSKVGLGSANEDCPDSKPGDQLLGNTPQSQVVRINKAINLRADGTKIDNSLPKCAELEATAAALGVAEDKDCPDNTPYDTNTRDYDTDTLINRNGELINLTVEGIKKYDNVPKCAEIYDRD